MGPDLAYEEPPDPDTVHEEPHSQDLTHRANYFATPTTITSLFTDIC